MRYLFAMQVVPRAPWRHPWPGNSPFANSTCLPVGLAVVALSCNLQLLAPYPFLLTAAGFCLVASCAVGAALPSNQRAPAGAAVLTRIRFR